MKTHLITVLVLLFSHSIVAQDVNTKSSGKLMDSLQGKWIVTRVTNNKKNIEPKGFIEFQTDGKFVSNNSYFGSTEGKYNTNETQSTLYVEIDGTKTEWTADIRNRVLRLSQVRKNNEPKVTLVLSQATAAGS